MVFPKSGVEVNPIVPPLVALVVAAFTSRAAASGVRWLQSGNLILVN